MPVTIVREQVFAVTSLIATVAMAILFPALIVGMFPNATAGLAFGALAWSAALVVKLAVGRIPGVARFRAGGKAGAAIWGLFSGLAELGFLAVFIAAGMVPRDAIGIIAAGLGAASLEIVYILAEGVISDFRQPDNARYLAWLRGARRSLWVANMIFIERFATTILHVGTRGLLAVSMNQMIVLPVTVAMLSFGAVDGVATYGISRKWNWYNPIRCRRFYQFVLLVGLLNLALFAWYMR